MKCIIFFQHVLNESKNKTVQEAGIKWTPLDRLSIIIGQIKAKPMSLFVQESEDDLLLGASASPTAADVPSTTSLAPPATHQVKHLFIYYLQGLILTMLLHY